ncbi:MAG: hypothetical protein K2K77_01560, partial [Duncaniella sp.]|nr:hypothetical protein [Duncaniella sp.]
DYTALTSLAEGTSSSVSVNGKTLRVSGGCDYSIYSIAGQRIYSGNAPSFSLPSPGIYLVKTPKSVTKIVAR